MKMETRSKAIDKIYKRRGRIEMPDFQREEVWPDSKKRKLIDSILHGWSLPKFYFSKIDNGTFDCVDGQQRLIAISEFFGDNLVLSSETAKIFGGSKYSELPDDISDDFDDFEIQIEEIDEATDEELEELFSRLQLGTPLNTAEKLNAISGDLRNFCFEISNEPFLSEKIALKNTRYAHFEIVTRWLCIESRGIQPQNRFSQLESFLKDNRTFSKESETAKKAIRTINYLEKAFPENCRYIGNRANTLSICMLGSRVASQNLDSDTSEVFREFVESFFYRLSTEVEKGVKSKEKAFLRYQQAITSGSTGGDSIRERINILTTSLAQFSQKFSTLLGSYPEAGDEIVSDISDLATTARELILDINRRYSGQKGEDLFKMTTESTASFLKIAKPIRDIGQYGEFIDSLYFLIYEGTGNCKRLPSPPPEFSMDAKFLRAGIRHDVNHGEKKDIAKKKVRNAQVFEKYSGKKTPSECSSDDFLTIQVRILKELISFLEMLNKD